MSSLTSLISGGGGGSLVEGQITRNGNINANTTITCPSGKYIRVISLCQTNYQYSGSNNFRFTLSFGSRTIINNELAEDVSPYMFYGHTNIGIGGSQGGPQMLRNLTGKKDENLVISGVSITGSAQLSFVYQIMEDA